MNDEFEKYELNISGDKFITDNVIVFNESVTVIKKTFVIASTYDDKK